jgi:hypothetical protein
VHYLVSAQLALTKHYYQIDTNTERIYLLQQQQKVPTQLILFRKKSPRLLKHITSTMIHERNTVRFQEEPDFIEPVCQELMSGSWLSREEFKRFRMNYQMMAQGIRYRHEGDANNPASYTNVLSSTYLSCVNGCSPSQANLTQLAGWFEVGTSRLGLENMSVKTIKSDRKKRSRNSIRDVLKAQVSVDNDPEAIRNDYRQATKSARLFALALADAAELANKQEEEAATPDARSSIFTPRISQTNLRFKMQRQLLFDNLHHSPENQFNLPLWRRSCTGTAAPM